MSSVRSICHRQQVLGKGIHADSCVAPWNPITRTSTSITSCIFSVNTVTHSKPPAEAAWHWTWVPEVFVVDLHDLNLRINGIHNLRHPTASCSCSSWKRPQMPESSFFPANDHPVILLVLSLKPRLPAESPLSPTDRPG